METKQQLNWYPDLALLDCCLLFSISCAASCTGTVTINKACQLSKNQATSNTIYTSSNCLCAVPSRPHLLHISLANKYQCMPRSVMPFSLVSTQTSAIKVEGKVQNSCIDKVVKQSESKFISAAQQLNRVRESKPECVATFCARLSHHATPSIIIPWFILWALSLPLNAAL